MTWWATWTGIMTVALVSTGCTGITAARYPTATKADSYTCAKEAQQASGPLMDASPLWRAMLGRKSSGELYDDCMAAKGYVKE